MDYFFDAQIREKTMRVDEILAKYQVGNPITNEELNFVLKRVDSLVTLMADFPREFLLFRHALWNIQNDFGLMKSARKIK